jgi:hypothetical protein
MINKNLKENLLMDDIMKDIGDETMGDGKNKLPKINFIDKMEVFKQENEFYPHMFLLDSALESLRNEKICKVQELSDLTRIKAMFGTIGDGNYSYWNLGSKSYLFLEDGKVKLKTMENWISTREFETGFGKIICQNNGEWGGCIYIINDGEVLAINSGWYSFDGIYEYKDKVFVCEMSTHLGGSCSLHEIIKDCNSFVLKTIFGCDDLNFAGYHFEDNYLYFYSTHLDNGLYRFNLDSNELELIHGMLCSKVSVNSLLKKDNYIYIYGKYNLIKYNLNTKTHEVFTNLEYGEITDEMYADGKKLFDLWNELIIRDD